MSCVAVLASLPLDMHDSAQPAGFQHRIRRGQGGENGELKQREGQDAEPAGIPRMRRDVPQRNWPDSWAPNHRATCLPRTGVVKHSGRPELVAHGPNTFRHAGRAASGEVPGAVPTDILP